MTVKAEPDVPLPDDTPVVRKSVAKEGEAAADLPPVPVPKVDRKPTMEWYQSNDRVTVSFLIRDVAKDKCEVDIKSRSLSVHFPLPGSATGADYAHEVDRLFGEVDVAKSSYRVLGSKVEVVLHKATPGQKWSKLESVGSADASNLGSSTMSTASDKSTAATTGPPAYPTSSKKGPKNWDKVVADLSGGGSKKKKDKNATSPSKHVDSGSDSSGSTSGSGRGGGNDTRMTADTTFDNDNNDIDDDGGGDPVGSLFKKIFADADDDTRKAMIKSYTESGGTALSTDWNAVKKEKQEIVPPQGMEARKW